MESIAVVAGGMLLQITPKADFYIGVDWGALWLLRRGITPDIAIGDFDSVSIREKKYIHDHVKVYIEYPSKKDESDLELAIREVIKHKPQSVQLYGVLGKRVDHSLAAIGLLSKLESHNIYGEIVDNFSIIQIVRRKLLLNKNSEYPYVSIFPIESCASVSLTGFAYNVSHKRFLRASSLGISNEIIGEVGIVTVHAGRILVIQSHD